MSPNELIAGAYYRTRAGLTVGPLRAYASGGTFVWAVPNPTTLGGAMAEWTYTAAGAYLATGGVHDYDLVARVPASVEAANGRVKTIFDYTLDDYREAAAANGIRPEA